MKVSLSLLDPLVSLIAGQKAQGSLNTPKSEVRGLILVKNNFRNNYNSLLLYGLLGRGHSDCSCGHQMYFQAVTSVGAAAAGFFSPRKERPVESGALLGIVMVGQRLPALGGVRAAGGPGHGASPAPAAHESLQGLLCASAPGNLLGLVGRGSFGMRLCRG